MNCDQSELEINKKASMEICFFNKSVFFELILNNILAMAETHSQLNFRFPVN